MASEPPKPDVPPSEAPAPDDAAAGEDGATVSKKAAKKAETKARKDAKKDALKAQRAVERAADQGTTAASQQPAEDPAKDNYGLEAAFAALSLGGGDVEEVSLKELGEKHLGKAVVLRAWIQNVRMQGAKMAFMELREEGNWAVQGVVAATGANAAEGSAHVISKNMVKWVGEIHAESFVVVEATVQKPYDPVKSCRVTDYELHIRKCYVVAAAPAMLGMTLAAANRAVSNFSDEDAAAPAAAAAAAEKEKESESAIPAATMLTHLDNIVMHKRAPVQQAIAVS